MQIGEARQLHCESSPCCDGAVNEVDTVCFRVAAALHDLLVGEDGSGGDKDTTMTKQTEAVVPMLT